MVSTNDLQLPPGNADPKPAPLAGESTTDLPVVNRSVAATSVPETQSVAKESAKGSAGRNNAGLAAGVVVGDFQIQGKIGQGAMGEVYRARQVSLDRTVALKLLGASARKNPALVERFTREAKTLGELDHPHIVKVLSTGELDGQKFVALEFIDGQPLEDWLKKLKQLSVPDALHVALVCAWALQHAHRRNVIHRDVKPSNVLVSQTGQCKLADFGIAKMQQIDLTVTLASEILGTPEYMAPEQCVDARHVSLRSDIYALGTMLYVLVTGKLPFRATSLVELVKLKQHGVFPVAKSINPDVPEKLDLVISKMLAPVPEQRYASCDEVLRDLAALRRHGDELSFVGADALPVFGPWTAFAAEASKPAPVAVTADKLASPTPDPIIGGEKEWFVHHKNRLGKSVVSKMLTTELITALDKKLLPPNAEVRFNVSEPFQSLVMHTEFHPALTRLGLKIPARYLEPKKTGSQLERGGKADSTSSKKRRKRGSEKWDLAARLGVGVLATYGFIRGAMDLMNLWR